MGTGWPGPSDRSIPSHSELIGLMYSRLWVVEIIPCFITNVAVGDSEIAPRNSFQNQFPHIHITGCYFIICKLFGMESEIQSWQVSMVRILIL